MKTSTVSVGFAELIRNQVSEVDEQIAGYTPKIDALIAERNRLTAALQAYESGGVIFAPTKGTTAKKQNKAQKTQTRTKAIIDYLRADGPKTSVELQKRFGGSRVGMAAELWRMWHEHRIERETRKGRGARFVYSVK